MNQPRTILVGPDRNYWLTNRGSNRITRYDASNGAKLNDVVDGAPLNGPAGLVISGDQLFVSNSYGNNLLRYTITNAATGTVSAATKVIPASAGLSAPEHILKDFFEDASTDPASFFKLIDYDLTPTAATLRFRSGTRNYQLQHSPNLQSWSPVPAHETIPGTGSVIEVTTPAPSGFYRIAAKREF